MLLFDRRGHRAQSHAGGPRAARRRPPTARRRRRSRAARAARGHGWETELRIAVDTLVPFARVLPLAGGFLRGMRRAQTPRIRASSSRAKCWAARGMRLAEGRADLVLGAPGDPPPGGGYRLRVMAEADDGVRRRARRTRSPRRAEPLLEAQIARHRARGRPPTRSRRLAPRTVGTARRPGHADGAGPRRQARGAGRGARLRLPARVHCRLREVAAGRLVIKAVEAAARHRCALHAAWREARPGKALAWWIDAVTRSDWSFPGARHRRRHPARASAKPTSGAARKR